MLEVQIKEDKYVLLMPTYDPTLVDFCRNLQAARYSAVARCWTAARNLPNALDLQSQGHFIDTETLQLGKAVTQTPSTKDYTWVIPSERYKKYGHQEHWRLDCKDLKKVLLVGEMGIGKTLMTMFWWAEHGIAPESIVVVCPASLIKNWCKEIKHFTDIEAIPVLGDVKKKATQARKTGLHIVSYETFVRYSAPFLHKSCVVIEESHKIKNPSSLRSRALDKFCSRPEVTHTICLTGTPISQGVQDYYSQYRVIEPRLLGSSYTAFKRRYCIEEPVRGAPIGIKRVIGYQNLDELTKITAPYTRTYLKKDCLDLPPKTHYTRYVELSMSQRAVYKQLKKEMAVWLNENKDSPNIVATNVLTRLLRFSQITQGFVGQEGTDELHEFSDNPKLAMLEEIIDELGPQNSFIVMCKFRKDIINIEELLIEKGIQFGVIHGDVAIGNRQVVVDDFQAGNTRALIGQVASTGLGFTLTKAQTMIFYSNSYSYTDRLQAEDRIHRIGTQGTCVYIDIVAQDTVDEHVIAAIKNKQDVANMMMELRNHFTE